MESFAGELVLVDWNPPPDRPPLREAADWNGLSIPVRIITVPSEIHQRFTHSKVLPIFEYVAKNVAIRHARGEWILATNPDNTFIPPLSTRLEREQLHPNNLYRAQRHDLGPDGKVCFVRAPENAGGDFILMHKDHWIRLQGHPEAPSASNIDSAMIELALHNGLNVVYWKDPLYHQFHERCGFENRPILDTDNILKFRSDTWGLANERLDVWESKSQS